MIFRHLTENKVKLTSALMEQRTLVTAIIYIATARTLRRMLSSTGVLFGYVKRRTRSLDVVGFI